MLLPTAKAPWLTGGELPEGLKGLTTGGGSLGASSHMSSWEVPEGLDGAGGQGPLGGPEDPEDLEGSQAYCACPVLWFVPTSDHARPLFRWAVQSHSSWDLRARRDSLEVLSHHLSGSQDESLLEDRACFSRCQRIMLASKGPYVG